MMQFRDYLPKGLFARTFLIVVLPILILQLSLSVVFFDRHWSKMTIRLASGVVGDISAVAAQMDMMTEDTDDIMRILALMQNNLGMNFIFDAAAHALPVRDTGQEKSPITKDLIRLMVDDTPYPFQVRSYLGDKLILVDVLTDTGVLTVGVPEGRLYSASSYIFILWMIGLSVFLMAVALIFMRNQIRPIYRLGLIAERMGRGIPVGRFKPTGAREVRQAAEAFIRMQDRINQFVSQRTTMLAGVSHDLRTPLTRMKLQLEMMGDTPDVAAMKSDIADMENMIGGYLAFARGDEGEEMQRILFDDILDKICDDARRLSLTVIDRRSGTGKAVFWCKPKALERALGNFLSNAARYADTVAIDARISDDVVEIRIGDNGPGISEEMRVEVMKPFVRGEHSRNVKTGGVGLGLTIANDIIASHAGQMSLDKSVGLGGLEVVITLPL